MDEAVLLRLYNPAPLVMRRDVELVLMQCSKKSILEMAWKGSLILYSTAARCPIALAACPSMHLRACLPPCHALRSSLSLFLFVLEVLMSLPL